MSEPQDNPHAEQHRPDDALTALLPDESAVRVVVAALAAARIDAGSIRTAHGDAGIESFDLTGERHGWWAHLVRSWKLIGGADSNVLSGYDAGLREGQWLIAIPVHGHDRDVIVKALRQNGATSMNHFRGETLETIP